MIDYREVVFFVIFLEKQLKIFSLVIFVVMVVYCIINFISLLNEILIYFNVKGEVDGWGIKNILFFILGVCVFLFMMMYFIGIFKFKIYNFFVKFMEDNVRK